MPVYKRPVSQRMSVKRRPAAYQKRSQKKKARTITTGPQFVGAITKLGSDYGFPDRLRTKLRYSDVFAITSTLGAVTETTFRLNGLYDPDSTNIGHQPMWYDQLTTVYGRYRVYGAKITVSFVPTEVVSAETGDTGPFIVGITTTNNATLNATSYGTLLENNNTVSDIIVDKQGGNNMKTLSNTFSLTRDLGLDYGDDTSASGVGGLPSQQYYAHVWVKDMDESSNTRVVLKVQIEYLCEFFQRIEGTGS